MIIKLKDLLEKRSKSIVIDEAAEGFEYNSFRFEPSPVKGKIWIDSDMLKMKLDSRYTFTGQCDRCLEDVTVSEEFVIEDEMRLSDVENGEININETVTESILLNMPNKVLCRNDCLGLCPDCGMNLNKGKCSCAENRINPQFAALEKLLGGKG